MGLTDAVDIVVLNCNNDLDLRECVNSIKQNTEGRYNLIIVDQNSQDGSREWLIENKIASHLILNKRNKGVAVGYNQGIRAGRYPWIAFIDSDVVIKDNQWLDKMWNYTIDRRVGLIEGCVKIPTQMGKVFNGLAFCLIRRQCLNELGLFSKEFYVDAEKEFFIKIEDSWWKSAFCYDVDIFHRRGGTTAGVLKDKIVQLREQTENVLKHKYTQDFLTETLGLNSDTRAKKEKELLSKDLSI
ncbi:glycosyltransferase family 2 protein [Candidatus Omnitrophota bacterium]